MCVCRYVCGNVHLHTQIYFMYMKQNLILVGEGEDKVVSQVKRNRG